MIASDNDDNPALAEAYLQHELMNKTKTYLDRGRRFAQLDVTQLADRWIAVFTAYFAQHYRSKEMKWTTSPLNCGCAGSTRHSKR